ncbi:MAG: HD domain-containing protein [Chloroflexota bacterium]|nr:HD domain-containing protein [Chloroflexota bacterium]
MIYRIRQALRAIRAARTPIDPAAAARWLSPPLLALFVSLRRSEQAHALAVLHSVDTLWRAEHAAALPDALAVAALLHDVGKARLPLALWGRTLPVIVGMIAPSWIARLAAAWVGQPHPSTRAPYWSGGALLRPFAIYIYHPAWGADIAREAGAAADAVWLIAHHSDAPLTVDADAGLMLMLGVLQRADGAN